MDPHKEHYELDCAVIGGGVFGCWLAVHLAREHDLRVILVERESELLQRASLRNQARVHNGYHYPRSILTGLRSRVNSERFLRDFGECVDSTFAKYYAVARDRSNVTAAQFESFCRRIEAPLAPAEPEIARLFDRDLIEQVWRVEEWAFDAVAMARRFEHDLEAAGVEVLRGHEALRVARNDAGRSLTLRVRDLASGVERTIAADHVFNATYSGLNAVLGRSKVDKIALKQEVTEICLVEVPPELERVGVTVMCGPFFSFMPFPARRLHSLSHVRYTPHSWWLDRQVDFEGESYFRQLHERSNFLQMQRDAARYMPIVSRFVQRDSLFELKTVLPQSEGDDSRPILFRRHAELPGLVSLLGGKVDNVYDLAIEVEVLLGHTAPP